MFNRTLFGSTFGVFGRIGIFISDRELNMRMWCVNPNIMCRQHLLGEHVELHMFVGAINSKQSLTGFVEKGLVEVHNIEKRHKQLVKEMGRRGYNHKSPLPKFKTVVLGKVFKQKSLDDLLSRCPECRKRFKKLRP